MIKHLKRLIPCILIGILLSCVVVCSIYQDKKKHWQIEASHAFRLAVVQELQKRDTLDIPYFSGGKKHPTMTRFVDMTGEPKKVQLRSEHGEKTFVIPYEKHVRNIVRDSDVRMLHTGALILSPLVPDSLNQSWKSLLVKGNFPGETIVRISVSDWWEHEQMSYSRDSLFLTRCDSVASVYLGCRCEFGLTGYIYVPWWEVCTLPLWLMLFAVVAGCCLLGRWLDRIELSSRLYCYLVKRGAPKAVVLAEKPASLFLLEDGFSFNADSGELRQGIHSVKLTPTQARLLRVFLEADGYELSSEKILDLVWPEGTVTPANLHTAIKRLRTSLSQVSDWTVVNSHLCYQLRKNPVSSAEANAESPA